MKRVTGLGGIFFKSADKEKTMQWYRQHLGIESMPFGFPFLWREDQDPQEKGYTVWAPFSPGTEHFDTQAQEFMINYRVDDLVALLEAFEKEGVEIVGEMKEEANGKFAWIIDPEGRKVELWEPVPSAEDPYLPK